MDDEIEMEPKQSSVRRTLTIRSSAARQVAVNFMPSKQMSHTTLRMRRSTSEHNALLEEVAEACEGPAAADKQAALIVRELEQHRRLMEDDPHAEEMRRAALRDLPQCLTMKRNVRAKLSASVSLRSKRRPISIYRRLKYRISFAWKRFQDHLRDFIFSIELWYDPIRNIEGNFGSAVGSYFYFLRWLFLADALLAALVVAFVVVPQAMHDHSGERAGSRGFLDFISGKGGYADSLLFYGHYHDGAVAARGPLHYAMPFAYFFTMVCLYLAVFAVLCYKTAYSYRRNFIETAGGLSNVFASKVFCSWDFGIVSPQAAALSANSVYNELKELLNEQNKNQVSASFCVKVLQCAANVAVTALVLALIGALEYGIWRLVVLETVTSHWAMLVSLTVTLAVALCPLLFGLLVRLEYYKPRTALYVTLARTWLLDVGTLTLLLYYWTKSGVDCWETSFGQEAYRLVLLDCLVSLFVLPLVEFLRALFYHLHPTSSPPEFNIAYNSLTLIYNQAVVWFGLLFSPLLVVAVTLKFLLLFYVKRECALRACQPARKIWRAAQTQTVLYMLVTLSLFTTLFGVGSLFFRTTSNKCGPFRAYGRVYEVLTEGALGLSRHAALHAALAFATRPGVIAFLALFLCVAVYYMRAKALAQHSMVELLRHMLVLQAKDKEFLLAAISKVSNGEWLYSPRAEAEAEGEGGGPASHTWKYLHEVRKPSNAGFHFDASRLSHSFAEGRPRSYAKENRSSQYAERQQSNEDGDTDSSFSWQGSSSHLNQKDAEAGDKKWL